VSGVECGLFERGRDGCGRGGHDCNLS
jgi:hypothetical protein